MTRGSMTPGLMTPGLMTQRSLWIALLLVWSLGPMLWQLVSSFTTADASDQRRTEFLESLDPRQLPGFAQHGSTVLELSVQQQLCGLPHNTAHLDAGDPRRLRAWPNCRSGGREASALRLWAAALFPYVLLFLALLELARTFSLGNNLIAIALPYSALSMPLALLLLTAAFEALPNDLEDAAKLEGSLAVAAAALGAASFDCTCIRQYGHPGVPVRLERIPHRVDLAKPQRSAHIAGGDGPNCGIIHLFRFPMAPTQQPLCSVPFLSLCWCWCFSVRSSVDSPTEPLRDDIATSGHQQELW